MGEILGLILGSPVVRSAISSIVLEVLSGILHRRSADPEFLSKSNEVFAQFQNAKSDEEKTNAQRALQDLMAR